jgi:hypothetical protein
MSETVLPTYEETLKFVENRVKRTKELWDHNKGLAVILDSYYEGQHAEAQRILEFLNTGVPF